MKTLNLKKVQKEFLNLTDFHYNTFCAQVSNLPIDEASQQQMRVQADEFRQKLFDLAEYQNKSN